jgi:AcrR family transcriptional regulator
VPVNSADPERYPLRADRARRTHQALVTAAMELFAETGYAATTIDALAQRAGVSRATVFTSAPGGKPQLLKEARDQAIAGDDEPVPIPQRPWFLDAMAQTDPRELLRRQAANYRRPASSAISAAASSPGGSPNWARSPTRRRRRTPSTPSPPPTSTCSSSRTAAGPPATTKPG